MSLGSLLMLLVMCPLFAAFAIVAIPDKCSVSKPISVSHKKPSYKYEAIENRLVEHWLGRLI